ncbi:MAG: 50S ribosomal protein L11 [Candidatus Pacearchaeota archaeon]
MIIKLLVEAGNMKPTPAISQKLGPLGINMGKLIGEVNKATSKYAGLKVPVEVDIDIATKEFKVNVLTPSVGELLKKEIGITKGSMMAGSIYSGNISIEQVINIAKIKMKDMKVDDLKSAVKCVLGSCLSSGILVDSKNAKEILEEINNGVYDELIKKAETQELKPSNEKILKLKKDFEKISLEQEKIIKELLKAKETQAQTTQAETEKK